MAIASGWDQVIVHVHDLGNAVGLMPRLRPATAGGDGLVEGGRGLQIVAAIGSEWGMVPAAWCQVWGPGDPAAEAGGCCTWCRLVPGPRERSQDEEEGAMLCTP